MNRDINSLLKDIQTCRHNLREYHHELPGHLHHLQEHLQKLLEQGVKAYEKEGNHRHTTDQAIRADREYLAQFIRAIPNFGTDIRQDNAQPKLEALSQAAIEAHRRWSALFLGNYKEVQRIRTEGMNIFKDLVTLYNSESELEREEKK